MVSPMSTGERPKAQKKPVPKTEEETGKRVSMKIDPKLVAEVDSYRARFPIPITRTGAIEYLIRRGLDTVQGG